MANEWLRARQEALRAATRTEYPGSFIQDVEASRGAMGVLAETMGIPGPIFKWRPEATPRPLEAILNNAPGILSNIILSDESPNSEIIQVHHEPVRKLNLPTGDVDMGRLYVGGPREISDFFGALCRSMEEGKSVADIAAAARAAHSTHGPSYFPEDPEAVGKFRAEYARLLAGKIALLQAHSTSLLQAYSVDVVRDGVG